MMATDRDIKKARARKVARSSPAQSLVYEMALRPAEERDNQLLVEDTARSRAAMGIGRGRWVRHGRRTADAAPWIARVELDNPRREPARRATAAEIERAHRIRYAAWLREEAAEQERLVEIARKPTLKQRLAARRDELALQARRAKWGDRRKPDHVTDRQWEARRLVEAEGLTQTAAAQEMGISQPALRKLLMKARG